MNREDTLVGQIVTYTYSPPLTFTGVVSYVAERGPDGTPTSYLVHRQGFGARPEIVKVDEITNVLGEE